MFGNDKDWPYPLKDALWIIRKLLHICAWSSYQGICKKFFTTYDLIEDCARCFDCGRNVHDWHAPDWLWMEVIGHNWGVWCYDCFCDRADRKLGVKFRNYELYWVGESV